MNFKSAMRLGMPVAAVLLCLSVAAFGWGASAAARPSSTSKAHAQASGGNSSLTISDEYGSTWTCQFNPYNTSDVAFSFGPVYEELVFQNLLRSGAADTLAGHQVGVEQRQQDADVHHSPGRQMVGRAALRGQRRPLQLPAVEEEPGPRPQLGLVGALERRRQGL